MQEKLRTLTKFLSSDVFGNGLAGIVATLNRKTAYGYAS